jgi:hypothetical protein
MAHFVVILASLSQTPITPEYTTGGATFAVSADHILVADPPLTGVAI